MLPLKINVSLLPSLKFTNLFEFCNRKPPKKFKYFLSILKKVTENFVQKSNEFLFPILVKS